MKEILRTFANQHGNIEELEDILEKNNLTEVQVAPKENLLQMVAKKMNETYKEREIKDFFNLKNIKSYNISTSKKILKYPMTWNREDFPEDLLDDYDETWRKYRRLRANKNRN